MGIIGYITGSVVQAVIAKSVFTTHYITGTLIPFCIAHPIVGIPIAVCTLTAGVIRMII